MDENKLRILKMLQDGKINSEEAYKLLNASREEKLKGKKLVIKVKGKENVDISIPLEVVKAFLAVSGRIPKLITPYIKEKLEKQGIESERLEAILKNLDDLLLYLEEQKPLVSGKSDEYEFYIGIE